MDSEWAIAHFKSTIKVLTSSLPVFYFKEHFGSSLYPECLGFFNRLNLDTYVAKYLVKFLQIFDFHFAMLNEYC